MEKHVSHVSPHKNGTVLNVLIDVTLVESGMLALKHVYVQLANSGTDMLVLSVQMEEPGTSIPNPANAQSHQHGTESLASLVLEVESTITLPINVNAQAAKPTMDSFVLSIAQSDNSIMKPSGDVHALKVNFGMETSVSSVLADKHGTLL